MTERNKQKRERHHTLQASALILGLCPHLPEGAGSQVDKELDKDLDKGAERQGTHCKQVPCAERGLSFEVSPYEPLGNITPIT